MSEGMKGRKSVRNVYPDGSLRPHSDLALRFPLFLGLLLICLAGCTSPTSSTYSPPGPSSAAYGAPDWVGEPQSWTKLESIERWLYRDADRYDSYWRIQGELTLGEGRLEFARREDRGAGHRSQSWSGRLASARSGFERVLANSNANTGQRLRAQNGLAEVVRLHGGAAPAQQGKFLSRATWHAAAPAPSRLDRATGGYDRITLHHSADVRDARFDGSMRDSTTAIRSIQRDHVDGRRYGDIGYHFLVDPAGRIFLGRDLGYQGAHAGGVNNKRNIGICLLGNFETTRPTSKALAALTGLLSDLRGSHRIERSHIFGHRQFKSTLCPGAHLATWMNEYRRTGPQLSALSSSASLKAKATRPTTVVARRTVSASPASVRRGGPAIVR